MKVLIITESRPWAEDIIHQIKKGQYFSQDVESKFIKTYSPNNYRTQNPQGIIEHLVLSKDEIHKSVGYSFDSLINLSSKNLVLRYGSIIEFMDHIPKADDLKPIDEEDVTLI